MTTTPPTIAEVLAWAQAQSDAYKRRLFQEVDTKRISAEHADRERRLSDAVVKCLAVMSAATDLKVAGENGAKSDDAALVVCTVRVGTTSTKTFAVDANAVVTDVEQRRAAVARFERNLMRAARSVKGGSPW